MTVSHGQEAARQALEDSKRRQKMAGHFLQFKDGDYAIVAFLGEPMVREVIWEGNKTRAAKQGEKGQTKFSYNVWVKSFCTKGEEEPTSINKLQTIEQGSGWYEKVIEQEEECEGNLHNNWFKIKRKGSGRDDTSYAVHTKNKLTDEEKADLKKVKLFNLEEKLAKGGNNESDSDGDDDEDGAVISKVACSTIKENMTDVPRDEVIKFTKKFKVARFKEIPEKFENEALELSESIKDQFAKSVKGSKEVDPFEDDDD